MASAEGSILRMNVDDLSEEELAYELAIRNNYYDETDRQRRQRLRKILLEEGDDTVILDEDGFFVNELPLVTRKLEEIEAGLRETIQVKWITQLRHWRERIYRAKVLDLAQGEQKVDILSKIRSLTKIYKATARRLMNLSNSEQEQDAPKAKSNTKTKKEKRKKKEKKKLETDLTEQIKNEGKHSIDKEFITETIKESIEKYFKNLPNITEKPSNNDKEEKTNKTEKDKRGEEKPQKYLGTVPKKNKEKVKEEKNSGKSSKREKKNKKLPKESSTEDDSSSLDSLSSLLSSDDSSDSDSSIHTERSRDYARRDDRFQHYRLDKWGIQFSGDSHGMDVSDFVFQVNELIIAERIPNDRFLDQAYILFAGEARRWYFTYKKKYKTWDKFSKQLKIRFGDPNKDRKILQDIKDRKQRKGESFVAFCSEIEGMFERMTKQYSDRKRLKVLRNNMRRWYKTKLSFYKIKNIAHLNMLCQQLDKDSGRIYSKSTHPTKKHIRNVDATSNSSSSSSDEQEVCAFNKREGQRRKFSEPQKNASGLQEQENLQQPLSLCWNCRKYGHRWRDCKQPKVIFCHACGTPGVTFFTCPKSHMLPQQTPKNENPEEK